MFIHTYNELYLKDKGWSVAAFKAGIDTLAEIKQWCYITYGPPGDKWLDDICWGEIRFEDKKDLVLFVLRWSGHEILG